MKRVQQDALTEKQRKQLRKLMGYDPYAEPVVEKELAELRATFPPGTIISTNYRGDVQQVIEVERYRKKKDSGDRAYLKCRTANGQTRRRNYESAMLVSIVVD